MEMSTLTRDGTVKPVSRDQILRRERRQGNVNFPCSADHVQDWQPYPVDSYSCYMCDNTYIHAFAPTATRSYSTTVCVLFFPLGTSLFPIIFVPLPFSLINSMESNAHRKFFPSGWCFFYLVTTGWIFYF